ncbi:MAG: hypothetical protein NVS4B7_00240 [Ktedonobacteraceae bacterium]
MDPDETIEARLNDNSIIRIEAVPLGGEERIADIGPISFADVTDTVEHIAQPMVTMLKKIKPSRGSVEFGIQVGVESGKLTALLVKGTGSANLKITLEWEEEKA